MSVIPFNPNRGRATVPTCRSATGLAGACASESDIVQCGADAADRCDRIEVLERALIDALRENAANWARAERAERLLRDE